jgi:electron transfer flavoprotein alpha subunit
MVLVFSEDKTLAMELLAKAAELAKTLGEKVSAVMIGTTDNNIAQEFIAHGADQVFMVDTAIDEVKAEEYAAILATLIKDAHETVLLIGSTKHGKELASRLAGLVQAGCIVDAVNLSVKDKKLTAERVVYSGNALAEERFTSTPAIVTIPPRMIDPLPADTSRKGDIISKTIKVTPSPSKIVSVQALKTEGVNVEDAEIIVSCGRGFKNKNDVDLATKLADALKGHTVGCSRPIAADLKWLSEDHWIGLSGHKVKPKLYIAAGISGQIQHIAGMRDSGVVVAINKDPDALIFKSADYGIVGDLYEVLPKLTAAIQEKMK